MVTNLYEVLNSAATVVKPESLGTQSGTIKDMNNLYVNFENSNAYFLYASTGATVTLNGSSATVSEIATLFKEGNEIKATLTLDSNNRITKMATTAELKETEEEKETEGIITKITHDEEDDDGKLESFMKATAVMSSNKTSYYMALDLPRIKAGEGPAADFAQTASAKGFMIELAGYGDGYVEIAEEGDEIDYDIYVKVGSNLDKLADAVKQAKKLNK